MQKRVFLSSILSVMVLVTSSCSSTHSAVSDTHDQADTFETYNRAMFKFNYQIDKYVLKPLAEGYRAITNQYARDRISSVIANLKEPLYATNNLLQGEFTDSGMSLARFAVNSTLGLAGMYDVAEGWGWPRKKAGFDSTLANGALKTAPTSFCRFSARAPRAPLFRLPWIRLSIRSTGQLITMPTSKTKLCTHTRRFQASSPESPSWIFGMTWNATRLTFTRPCVRLTCKTAASPAVIMMKILRERLLTTLTSALKTKT